MNQNERHDGAISLIVSQTNYTKEEAKDKLLGWNGNYMNVIKEYLNPNFNKKKEKKNTKSVNENMMYEIRNFMDTVSADFLKRKKEEEAKKEYLQNVYNTFLEVKKNYPDCKYNPPNDLSCYSECKNPLCPGELLSDNTYSKMNKVNNEKIEKTNL